MLRIAEQIGSAFDFVRVDLYDTGDEVFFGELTIYPGAGYERFATREDDLFFGSFWRLPGNESP